MIWKKTTSIIRELRVLGIPLSDYFEGLVALLLATLGDMISGLSLGVGGSVVSRVRGAMILVPTATDLRGNIFASMGSRLGTLLHIGELRARIKLEPKLVEELYATLFQSFILSLIVGVIAGAASTIILGPTDILAIASISVLSSIFSYILMVSSTILIAVLTYRRGWDPDNFSAPVLTLFGDMVTIPSILLSVVLILEAGVASVQVLLLATFIYISLIGLLTYKLRGSYARVKKIILESMPVLVLSSIFSLFSGVVLEASLTYYIKAAGFLVIVPAFLEDGGAIAGMLAARISTRLHLGELDPKVKIDPTILGEYVRTMVLGGVSFSLVGLFGNIISTVLGLEIPPPQITVAVTFIAGSLLVMFSNILTYIVSVASFRKGLDPDNVTIPILTSIVDLSGITVLVLVIILFG